MLDTIICGSCLDVMAEMPDGAVHCSVTSPPYFALRKYSGEQQTNWPQVDYSPIPGLSPITTEPMICALGHEPTVEAYIGHLVMIYKEVRRVLRGDGVAWIVMGDSFAGSGKGQLTDGTHAAKHGEKQATNVGTLSGGLPTDNGGLVQGNLMMVPHRLALALQADGWVVRNDLVYQKKSPMPESVAGWRWEKCRVKIKARGIRMDTMNTRGDGCVHHGDTISDSEHAEWQGCPGCPKCEANGGYVLRRGSWRHTRAHEFVFQLTKQMGYFADQEAVREPAVCVNRMDETGHYKGNRQHETEVDAARMGVRDNREAMNRVNPSGRNPRSVLCPSPEPFPGPHFAVFPSGLITDLIKATCPARCCPECGQGWAAVVEKGLMAHDGKVRSKYEEGSATNRLHLLRQAARERGGEYVNTTHAVGYRPTCECGHDDGVPGLVFDPFMGSGTTALVATRLGRHFYGCDISQEYVDIANERIAKAQLAMPI